MTLEIEITNIKVYDNLKLIINQLSCQYVMKHEDLKPYFIYARRSMDKFEGLMLEYIQRSENKRADAVANLAIVLAITPLPKVSSLSRKDGMKLTNIVLFS